ncbi:MAG: class I SAM-dependent methyltransferase [Acidobacteriota bacterium]
MTLAASRAPRAALARAVDALVDDAYLQASSAAVTYVGTHCTAILEALEWRRCVDAYPQGATAEQLGEALDVPTDRRPALAWILAKAAATGPWVKASFPQASSPQDSAEVHYSPGEEPGQDLTNTALWSIGRHRDGVGSTIPMIEYIAARYPAFLRGEKSGAAILLKGEGLTLWEDYFAAANPLYEIHNQALALGVDDILERLGRPARILELGAGTGGGTAAVTGRLSSQPENVEDYLLSDIAPSFLVRILERLGATELPLRRKRVDFTQPLIRQGIEPASFDLILAVNALHNTPDLAATVQYLATALSDDGWLVLSESICQTGEHVHQDFIFNLLPAMPHGTGLGDAEEEILGADSADDQQDQIDAPSRFFSAAQWSRIFDVLHLDAEIYINHQGPELALLALARLR